MNLVTIFLTGLFTGALTCIAVQGGLLAATIAQRHEQSLQEKTKKTGKALPILSFLAAKLVAYTILGLLLGWFGSFFQLSLTANIILQLAVGIFMLGTAGNLLNIHPLFRYFILQPPRFLTRLVRKESKSKSIMAPAILGAFTVFIPCGATQAMMALAIASGNPLSGAAIMFAFVLGTSPLFFLFGYLATRLGESMQQKFTKVAAYALILLAVFNLNNVLALTGSKVTLESFGKEVYCALSYCENYSAYASSGIPKDIKVLPVDKATITIEETGYNPDNLTVKAGTEVTLNLKNVGGGGCTQAFTVPSLNIQKIVPIGASDKITFTAPTEPGELAFMCSMGMYRGTINVI
ncbi:MAG: sulfite exporter TauE/SafE family protein [Candidatus Levybacteria bacterium]|nr:sulfite exporter TauE/SafE family protein [Candidatus Levybacteria bacterium]